MAYATGTVANHTAMWDTLLTFLTTNATLVSAGQAWTKVWEIPGQPEVVMRSPSGAHVAMKRTDETLTAGESVIWLSGCTGVVPSAPNYMSHVNSLARGPAAFLDHNPMTYWIVANGRRFVLVVKMSTVYQAIYGGFFLPYAAPTAYPYPMFIGGTRGFSSLHSFYQAPLSWRAVESDYHRQFVYPRAAYVSIVQYCDSPATMMRPDAIWMGGTIDYNGTMPILPRFVVGPRGFPSSVEDTLDGNAYLSTPNSTGVTRFGYNTVRSRMIAGLNGELALTPITLMAFNTVDPVTPVTYGILDGCYSVPGYDNSAETIITVGGVNHLVVANIARTGVDEYWALALE
jgi:hypothetical protein